MELGYARVSTVKQDLNRQIDALEQAGIPRERIYVDKKSGPAPTGPGCGRFSRTRARATSSSFTRSTGSAARSATR